MPQRSTRLGMGLSPPSLLSSAVVSGRRTERRGGGEQAHKSAVIGWSARARLRRRSRAAGFMRAAHPCSIRGAKKHKRASFRERLAHSRNTRLPNMFCTSIITKTIKCSKGGQHLRMLGTVFDCDLVMGKTSKGPGPQIHIHTSPDDAMNFFNLMKPPATPPPAACWPRAARTRPRRSC